MTRDTQRDSRFDDPEGWKYPEGVQRTGLVGQCDAERFDQAVGDEEIVNGIIMAARTAHSADVPGVENSYVSRRQNRKLKHLHYPAGGCCRSRVVGVYGADDENV